MSTTNKYKVISAKGFHHGGTLLERGTVFEAQGKNAHIATALHFKQIIEITTKSEKPEPSNLK